MERYRAFARLLLSGTLFAAFLTSSVHAQPWTFSHAVASPEWPPFMQGKLGWSLAVSGDHVVAGSPLANDVGLVLCYELDAFVNTVNDTVPYQVLTGAAGTVTLFGASLAMDTQTLVTGHCSALDEGYCEAQADGISLHVRDGEAWMAQNAIARPAWVLGAFGHALAVRGDVLAIGAYRNVDQGTPSPIVYLYKRINGQWPLLPSDSLSGAEAGADAFGTALMMDDERLLIGADLDDESGTDAGAAYMYERDTVSGVWHLLRKLLASNGLAGDGFGRALALDASRCVVGAPDRIVDDIVAGAAYCFERDLGFPGNWGQTQMISPGTVRPQMGFGTSLALREDVLVVGAPYDPLTYPGESGSVFAFAHNGAEWYPQQWISPTDAGLTSVAGRCSFTLGLVEGGLLVGAPWAMIPGLTTATSGAVLVYTYDDHFNVPEAVLEPLEIWPVPAVDQLRIRCRAGLLVHVDLVLYNAMGQEAAAPYGWDAAGMGTIAVGHLAPGCWSVSLRDRSTGQTLAHRAFIR